MGTEIFCPKPNTLDSFNIGNWTRITVRQTDIRRKLFQECRVSRKDTDEVEIVLKEFGGEKFKVRISISTGGATLVSPDLSWRMDAHVFPALVVARVAKMLTAKNSTARLRLARRIDAVARTKKSSK